PRDGAIPHWCCSHSVRGRPCRLRSSSRRPGLCQWRKDPVLHSFAQTSASWPAERQPPNWPSSSSPLFSFRFVPWCEGAELYTTDVSRFPQARFLLSAAAPGQFPPARGAEVAFVGRSNAGKSSPINAITQRKALARTSKTPGRTRLLNFFELGLE